MFSVREKPIKLKIKNLCAKHLYCLAILKFQIIVSRFLIVLERNPFDIPKIKFIIII